MINLYKEIPLPNQIISLIEISSLKFYNVSYREYLTVYDEWVIGVYPFSVTISKSTRPDGSIIDLDYFNISSKKSGFHHQDFLSGKCDYDPCDIFEEVCGVKIHHGQSDWHLMYLNHTDDIKEFEEELRSILSNRRNKQIESLLK